MCKNCKIIFAAACVLVALSPALGAYLGFRSGVESGRQETIKSLAPFVLEMELQISALQQQMRGKIPPPIDNPWENKLK